jgi:formate hydrogenlyase subunit 6/NADH:ubiquinone oxidoreductase subunit I
MNEQQKQDPKFQDPKFTKFHGVDRDQIQWNPEIDENQCIGCGMCATSCTRSVYKYDYENRKSKVVNPLNCMVACQTCANLCPMGAISFAKNETPRDKAQKVVKDFQLLPKAKEGLEKRKEELKYK